MSTLKELFKPYFDYSNEEYTKIWDNAIIIVDTNIILHFYRCSPETRESIYKMLHKYKKRLWIPFQVAKEYVQRKKKVMIDSYKDCDKLENEIDTSINKIMSIINSRKDNHLKCKSQLLNEIDDFKRKTKKIIEKEKESKNPSINEKEIEKKVLLLFNDNVGEDFSKDEYEKVKKEGTNRQKNDIPPGYMDKEKSENGDYYIFYSMIEKAKKEKKDIIFITDDIKEDWFNDIHGEKFGGRWELLEEFYKESGQLLLIYSLEGFIKKNNNRDKNNIVGEEALKELNYIRRKEKINNINANQRKIELTKNMIEKYYDVLDNEEKLDLLNSIRHATNPEKISSTVKNALKSLNNEQLFYIKELYDNNYDEKIITNYLINLFTHELQKEKKSFEKIGSMKQ